jgi:hypothetical protein
MKYFVSGSYKPGAWNCSNSEACEILANLKTAPFRSIHSAVCNEVPIAGWIGGEICNRERLICPHRWHRQPPHSRVRPLVHRSPWLIGGVFDTLVPDACRGCCNPLYFEGIG